MSEFEKVLAIWNKKYRLGGRNKTVKLAKRLEEEGALLSIADGNFLAQISPGKALRAEMLRWGAKYCAIATPEVFYFVSYNDLTGAFGTRRVEMGWGKLLVGNVLDTFTCAATGNPIYIIETAGSDNQGCADFTDEEWARLTEQETPAEETENVPVQIGENYQRGM